MTAEHLAILVGSVTGLLAVILTFLTQIRKRDVDSIKIKMETLKTEHEECRIELKATKEMFRDTEQRMQRQVQDLLIRMATHRGQEDKS